MTAIGLFVAVPAVLAYNWLQARNKTIASSLAVFSNELIGFMSSDGRLKPAPTAAAAGKPASAAVKK
jgi:biopolymer transport protein ExbB